VVFLNHDGESPPNRDWREVGNDVAKRMRRSELLALTESQLPQQGRTLILINGVLVPEWKNPLAHWLTIANGVGSYVWLDLRGSAIPRLRTDRQSPTRRQEVEPQVLMVQERYKKNLVQRNSSTDSWLRLALFGLNPLNGKASAKALALENSLPNLQNSSLQLYWLIAGLIQEDGLDLRPYRSVARDCDFDIHQSTVLDADFSGSRASGLILSRDNVTGLEKSLNNACSMASKPAKSLDIDKFLYIREESITQPDQIEAFVIQLGQTSYKANHGKSPFVEWAWHVRTHLLSEAMQPSLESSFPPTAWPGAEGRVGSMANGA
jgi:hypothetical protein